MLMVLGVVFLSSSLVYVRTQKIFSGKPENIYTIIAILLLLLLLGFGILGGAFDKVKVGEEVVMSDQYSNNYTQNVVDANNNGVAPIVGNGVFDYSAYNGS